MIYRPDMDVSGRVRAGIYFSATPELELATGVSYHELSIADPIHIALLVDQDHKIINENWAVNGHTVDGFPDCMGALTTGTFAASGAMVDAINGLEPNTHEIVDLPRVWAQGDNVAIDRPYFLVNVFQKIKCLDMERSNVSWRKNRRTGEFRWSLSGISENACHVIEEKCRGKHLRYDELANEPFLSQELHDRFWDVGCLGMDVIETTLV